MSWSCAMLRMFDRAIPSTIGRASALSSIRRADLAMPCFVGAGIRMDAPSAASQTDSLQWHAFCCNNRPCLALRPDDRTIKRPHSVNRCFSVRPRSRFSVPTYRTSRRREQRRSRLAASHRRRRRNAVFTAASTARSWIRLAARMRPQPRHAERQRNLPRQSDACRLTAPLISHLLQW